MSIENPTVWTETLLSMNTVRMDVRDKIKSAGFDVRDVAGSLKNFYIDLEKESTK